MKLFTKIKAKTTNEWVLENLRHLPLLLFIGLAISLISFISFFIDIPGKEKPTAIVYSWKILLQFLNILIIPLCAINLIYFLKRKFFKEQSPWVFMGVKFLAVFIGVTLGTLICDGLERVFVHEGLIPFKEAPKILLNGRPFSNLGADLMFNNIVSLFISIPIFLNQSRKQDIALKLKEKELELNRMQQVQTKAQLELLQSKINPHFLYNSLNSIASLAHEDPDKVEKMAISLSKLFRYSINTSANHYSTIKEEIEIVQTYLDIEKIRFGDKLNFTIHMNADESLLIPRFLIQPLVENSIKHGTSKITETGQIRVSVHQNEDTVEIAVHDNGPGFPDGLMSGYGLQSTQEKLNLLFKGNHELQILNGDEKQIKIVLKKIIQNELAV